MGQKAAQILQHHRFDLVVPAKLWARLRTADPGPGAVATGVLLGGVLAVSLDLASLSASIPR